MRFLIIRRADSETEAGVMPSAELNADMTAYNEDLVKAGIMRGGDGLHPSSKAYAFWAESLGERFLAK